MNNNNFNSNSSGLNDEQSIGQSKIRIFNNGGIQIQASQPASRTMSVFNDDRGGNSSMIGTMPHDGVKDFSQFKLKPDHERFCMWLGAWTPSTSQDED